MTSVGNYVNWMHREANRILAGPTMVSHDDLFQEGMIAAWRQEQKHGGEHAGFMTSEAALRMRQVAQGGSPFGNAGRGRSGRDVKPEFNLDALDAELAEALAPREADFAEWAQMAYHHGELNNAISQLPPRQREAVLVILAGGIMDPRQRAAWVDARVKLRVWLEHLDD